MKGIMNEQLKKLGERVHLAWQLRESGLGFKEIGERMGISSSRAQQIYSREKWRLVRPELWDGFLSVRASNCLHNCGINSREETMEAYQSGRIRPLKHPRNYGWKTHKEVAEWLGLPEPKKPVPAPKACPKCGCNLS